MTDLMLTRPQRFYADDVERGPGGAVVHPGSAAPVAMNPTALALWELCDGATEVGEMVEAVCALFQLDAERARTEVVAALREMAALGVIR